MDDNDEEIESVDDLAYDASHKACYIFRSVHSGETRSWDRPSKRLKLDSATTQPSPISEKIDLSLETRKGFVNNAWSSENVMQHEESIDGQVLSQLLGYVQQDHDSHASHRLRTALIMCGVDEADFQTILLHLNQHLRHDGELVNGERSQNPTLTGIRDILVELKAQQCSSLQVALKTLIRLVLVQANNTESYQDFLTERKKLLPLNYDLDLLEEFCHQYPDVRIIVSLSDVESFSNQVINELIPTLRMWKDRIPLFLILGIASTRELFEQRLSRSCLRLLDTKQFHFTPSANLHSTILRDVQREPEDRAFLGFDHTILLAINDICQKQGNSTQSVEQMLKLISMSHNLANPLAGVLSSGKLSDGDLHAVSEAVRRAESFREYCTIQLGRRDKQTDQKLKLLLNDDSELLKEITKQIHYGQQKYKRALEAVQCLTDLSEILGEDKSKLQQSRIETEAMLLHSLPDLKACSIYSDIREKLQGMDQAEISIILKKVDHKIKNWPDYMKHTLTKNDETNNHIKALETKNKRVRSQKQMSELESSLPTTTNVMQDYSSSKEDFLNFLERLAQENSFEISAMLLHESFIVSNRSLRLKQYFEPNPRVALERALTSPGDYLGCGCCGVSAREIRDENDESPNGNHQNDMETGSMPPISVLFILLQEAPTIINLRDLYDAFESRLQASLINRDDGSDGVSSTVMMLFYRALAELKMLGLVKESAGTQQVKRKAKASKVAAQDADFVAKTSWAGL